MKAALVLGLSFGLAASAAAKDIHVAEDGSGDYKKLSKALAAAVPGDVIAVKKVSGMVGMALQEVDGAHVVQEAIEGTPAAAAGIKKGDRILAVDGLDVASYKLPEIVARVRGPYGTTVTLKVADESGEREVAIKRGEMRWKIGGDLDKMKVARDEEDYETVADYAQKLAEGGVVDAQSQLAFSYFNGKGVRKDLDKAFSWASKAAEGGAGEAQRLLGYMYSLGSGTAANPVQSVYWYKKAVEKGDPYAMVNLGVAYDSGTGVPVDKPAALELYRRALSLSMSAISTAEAQSKVARLESQGVVAKTVAVPVAAPAPAAPSAAVAQRSDIDELPAPRAARPHAVAVVIGVERYREALPKADFAAADARLAAEYFKRVLGVSEENLALLVDERATKSDFDKYLEQWLPNHADKESDVFVFFSGHGSPDPSKGDAYLVPFDGDPTYIKQTGYSVKRLYAQLGKLPVKSVTVAMDSCFSGAGGRSVLAKGARPLVTLKTDAVPARVTVIAASAGDQISNSYQEQGHGLFTYFLLKGLKEKGDFKSAYDYLGPEVSRTARRKYNSDQTPQWRDGK
jgi:TPR repeat protein